MAFDIENATHRADLKTEVADDPNAQGYATALAISTQTFLALLTDPDLNVGGGTINRPTEELDVPEIAGVIADADYDALSAFGKIWVEMFINQAADVKLKPFQAKFQALFSGTGTLTAALALRAKPSSRLEDLFGVNSTISRKQWIRVRST